MNTDPKVRIPDMESLMLPILNFLGDGAPHSYSETEEPPIGASVPSTMPNLHSNDSGIT